jgi:hypothetical protein
VQSQCSRISLCIISSLKAALIKAKRFQALSV